MIGTRSAPSLLLRGLLTLAALVAGVGIACAAPVTLSIPTLEAKPGQEIEVPITVKGAKGMSALQMLLTYDPAVIEVVKDGEDPDKAITKGKILPGNAITKVFTTTPGRLPILFLGGADPTKKAIYAVEEDGTLLTIRFRVVGQANQKTGLTIEKAEAFQSNDMDMAVKTEAGELTVRSEFPWWWLLLIPVALLLLLIVRRVTRKQSPAVGVRRSDGEPDLVAVPLDEPIRHACVNCGRMIQVPPSLVGKGFKCPGCGTPQPARGS